MLVMKDMRLAESEVPKLDLPVERTPGPEYPYGLRICLTERELALLDLDPEQACVDGVVHLHAICCITSVSSNDTQGGGKSCRIELCMEKIAIESEDLENEETE